MIAKRCWWVILMGLFLAASAAAARASTVQAVQAVTVEVSR